MNILITDDEPLARERLRSLIDEFDEGNVIGEASNGKETLQQCQHLQPDIVLLDIRMPEMDGVEAALHLANLERPPAVIFTTAYGDHALAAFEAHAVDYLLKPIRKARLQEALQKAQQLNRAQLQSLQQADEPPAMRTHISARVRETIQLIPVEEILYFRADHKYVTVRHLHGEVLIEEPLKALEQEFASLSLRIHRNTLIFKKQLAGIGKDDQGHPQLLLRDCDDPLAISRRHLSEIKNLLKQLGTPLTPP
ncbi:MAG: LytTR family DNA-binding domain-containing protein [Gammaproteobacteria bacterium]|nr:LytTR family DNA-binding domain-containing protein [Gammaproteobacteria bacterium]